MFACARVYLTNRERERDWGSEEEKERERESKVKNTDWQRVKEREIKK